MTSLLLTAILLMAPAVVQAGKGTVTGRILSIDGAPAAGVRVTAMVVTEPQQGRQTDTLAIHASIAETDNAGRYRLENISPGRYYITAGLVTSPSYYPGASTASAATVLTVTDASLREGIDFRMTVPSALMVSGRLVVVPSPRSLPAMMMLTGASTFTVLEAQVRPDGTFEFGKVPPGGYTLLNAVGLPALPILVSDKDLVGIEVGAGAVGERVKGKLIAPDTDPTVLATHGYAGGADECFVFGRSSRRYGTRQRGRRSRGSRWAVSECAAGRRWKL